MKPLIRSIGAILGTIRAEYRQLANRYFGNIDHFNGDAREICEQVVEKLWEGDFYRTSLGHFNFFWMRDFGTVCESLIALGHKDRVDHTLKWAMHYYRRSNTISTCIDKAGNCFEAPSRAVDTMPWLLHCLVVSNYQINQSERRFLERQLKKYRRFYLEADGSIRKMKFSEMRDACVYDRSAYALSLVARMAICARTLGLENAFPYSPDQYQTNLIDNYWNGTYFNADIDTNAFSAECALFPFYLGGIYNPDMAARTFDYINRQKMNDPYPLRYTNQPKAFRYHWWMTAPFMPNYTGTSIWTWHGTFYLNLLRRYERPEYTTQYARFARLIERHGTYPELLNPDGSWYYVPIYRGDPGMVWAALFLALPKPSLR
jgi:hypothetical protein